VRVSITVPVDDPRGAGDLFADLERIGYHGAFSFESKHDPFLPLALGAEHTTGLRLGTAVAIAFARNPMVLANVSYDLQLLSEGRFVLGLGSQIKPHIERRFSSTWSRPADRMREQVLALHAIWDSWQTGERLAFDGDFFRHTLMTPAFDPGPNPFGKPAVFLGGYGERMVEVTGEVADGLIVHPFNTRRTLEERTLPALARGRARRARREDEVEVLWVTMIATWDTDAERERVLASTRDQLAFYGSTPAYRAVLDLHGHGDLHPTLNRLSKEGRWDEMGPLVPDDLVEAVAVVGPRDEIADRLVERVAGLTDSVGLVNSRHPDPARYADIVPRLTNR
jgi:probable F420-dependent oxidoreductase